VQEIMRRFLGALTLAIALAGCGGEHPTEPATKPKPDPYVTVRIQDQLDTTTKAGRAFWATYLFLSGPNVNLNAVVLEGGFTMTDARLNRHFQCMSVGADSIGQRLIALFAIGDTLHTTQQPTSAFDSIANRWYNGNHAPAAGYVILTMAPIDAWDSQQYAAGHGLTPLDPIKWAWDWTGGGTVTFTERATADSTGGCNTY
jgi:hypothetical protein